ncbi:MAG: CDP-glycerol glycerophosphotransferase family protein, partial [Actinobacteria bacterium]|nr:CDP-glycerol glycerophosphotransferase family protein [Actinomycetota bacterium]
RGRGSALLYRLRRTIAYMRRFRRVPWSLLASSSRKQLILINDRARYGNDNGEALFRHILEHRPELRNRTWFVLDERAPSYPELVRTGRVVQPLTFKHRRIYLNTRLHLSSHASATYNSPWSGAEAATVSDFADPTFVWLRHGVTMNSVDHVYSRFNNNLDGIVASTAYEKDYLLRPDSLFTERSVVTSGLPRFDLLQDRSREQDRRSLLYMPTWRVWLAGAPHPDGYRLPVPGFEQSEYFEQQQRLMSDPEVTEALQSANAHFEFLLHPVMAGYQELYASLASPTVVVRDPSSTSYSDLFARGAGMITDYSSVFVDFSYMGKPVIFDQSDVGRFRDGHYQKGLFDYETQAPGPVVGDYAQLKRATLELIRSDFAMPETYAARLDGFFLHHEGSSSDRALEAGIRIDEQRRGRGFSAAR